MEIRGDEMASKRCKGNEAKFTSVVGLKFDNDIPEWLLMEVLIRLPVKVVFRFKLVSKKWLSAISDPSFVRMYISRALMMPHRWIFVTMNPSDFQDTNDFRREMLVDVDPEDLKCCGLYVLPRPSIHHPHVRTHTVIRGNGGLLLYVSRIFNCCDQYYDILNPFTGQCIALPPPPSPHRRRISRGFAAHVENGILTSYRIVQLIEPPKRDMISLEVFYSETGVWQDFAIHADHKISFSFRAVPTDLNGILHWTTEKEFIAYDPYRKPDSLRFIGLPVDKGLTSDEIFRLIDVHEGRLRYFEMPKDNIPPHEWSSLAVWILDDYSIEVWCLQYKIGSANIIDDGLRSYRFPPSSLEPICFHPFDSEVVFLAYLGILYYYNIKSGKSTLEGQVDWLEWWFYGWKSTLLLVIPPWPVLIPPPSFRVVRN